MEEITVFKAKLGLKSYLKICAVFGLSLGVLVTFLDLAVQFFNLAAGDPSVGVSNFLMTFLNLLGGPISAVITGAISYPVYHYTVNRFFTMSITLNGQRDH